MFIQASVKELEKPASKDKHSKPRFPDKRASAENETFR